MMLVVLPALFYGFVHILGLYYPARLWGVDQLHYYPLPVAVFFMLIVFVTAGVAAKDSWVLRADETHVDGDDARTPQPPRYSRI